MAWDVTVPDTYAESYIANTAITPGAAAQTSAQKKTDKYAELSKTLFLALSRDTATTAIDKVEQCLTSLHAWFCHNGLSLNGDKSEALLLGTRQRLSTVPAINLSRF